MTCNLNRSKSKLKVIINEAVEALFDEYPKVINSL